MTRKGKKRLSVDLPIGLHRMLFEMAKKYNIKATQYLIRIIVERLQKEQGWDNDRYI